MDEQHDDAQVAMIVATVWGELGPAAERYLAPGTRTSHRRRRQRRAVGVGLVVAVVGTAGAVAARAALGDSAPPPLQASTAAIDEGMPDDLRLNPDVSNARSVARDGDAVMYAADLPDGGVCTEIAVGGKPAGAICRSGNEAPQPIEASIPGTPEDPASTPVVVGGRVAADADRVVVVVGEEVRIVLAPGGFFVVALDEVKSAAGRQRMLIEASKGSDLVASIDVSDAFTPESGTLDPIAAELISGDGDLSRVVSIYGTVQVARATTIRLVYPDGSSTEVAVGPDGHYEVALPAARQDDLADLPGRLIAVDLTGRELASRMVAAVSYWRTHDAE